MSEYHYQCQFCYCTTSMWTEDDGSDAFYGGAIEDCGCQNDEEDDWEQLINLIHQIYQTWKQSVLHLVN